MLYDPRLKWCVLRSFNFYLSKPAFYTFPQFFNIALLVVENVDGFDGFIEFPLNGSKIL